MKTTNIIRAHYLSVELTNNVKFSRFVTFRENRFIVKKHAFIQYLFSVLHCVTDTKQDIQANIYYQDTTINTHTFYVFSCYDNDFERNKYTLRIYSNTNPGAYFDDVYFDFEQLCENIARLIENIEIKHYLMFDDIANNFKV